MAITTSYKRTSLGYGSPPGARSSPFRQPGSPASPSPLRYSTTSPDTSPTKAPSGNSINVTTRFGRPTTPTKAPTTPTPKSPEPAAEMMSPPGKRTSPGWKATTTKSLGGGNALSQLQPTQVRTLRDGFQILDRDCDGVVNREDVADMLTQLGLPSGASDVGQFFPPSKPQTLTLPAFLNSLAETLAILSPSTELMSAFSAFDDDDSGQVDWTELKDALLNTPPEAGQKALTAAEVDKVVDGFTGRRAFNRNMNAHLAAKRGEVFKYQEFVNSIMGSNNGSDGTSNESSDD